MSRGFLPRSLLMATALMMGLCPFAAEAFDANEVLDEVAAELKNEKAQALSETAITAEEVSYMNREPSKQVEAPAVVGNSTSLLDTTSASDLIGFALNLTDLGISSESDGGSDPTAFTATISAYALQSTFSGFEPLSPSRYCEPDSVGWRRLSFIVGRENAEDGKESSVVAGAKYKLPFGTTLCDTQAFSAGGSIYEEAQKTAKNQAAIMKNFREALFVEFEPLLRSKGVEDDTDPLIADILGDEEDPSIVPKMRKIAKEVMAKEEGSVAALQKKIDEEIERLTNGPHLAIEFLTTQRDNSNSDEYTAALLFDYTDVLENVDFSANGSWLMEEEMDGKETHGGALAASFTYQPEDTFLDGRRPWSVSLSGRAEWKAKEDDVYSGQAKFVLPVMYGVELPISVTVASRTDLIDETDVRGQVGFTIDTAAILNSLK